MWYIRVYVCSLRSNATPPWALRLKYTARRWTVKYAQVTDLFCFIRTSFHFRFTILQKRREKKKANLLPKKKLCQIFEINRNCLLQKPMPKSILNSELKHSKMTNERTKKNATKFLENCERKLYFTFQHSKSIKVTKKKSLMSLPLASFVKRVKKNSRSKKKIYSPKKK